LVPHARIAIGHGQLPEAELERVMLAFMNHEYDVLVATSIIENGLDIPLANTIVINRADRHGLAELYQLRGRVGRSNRRAYAYLLIPPETELTEIARRRLAALKEFSDLGAGFKIAALDLELRGAGNMLGGEQSGHIEAIGFELYTSMLEEAVRKIKGEDERPAHAGTSINLGISVRIDSSYIPEENQRLRMYKRVAGAEDLATLADVRAELQDRYGEPPLSVLNLLAAAELRLLCERLGIAQLDRKRTQIELPSAAPKAAPQPSYSRRAPPAKAAAKIFVEMLHIRFAAAAADTTQQGSSPLARTAVDPAAMMKLVSRNAKRGAQFTAQGVLRWPLTSAKAEDVLAETRSLLEALNPQ
jgi:transcription-repair coupling factor (superfamily II helicase)